MSDLGLNSQLCFFRYEDNGKMNIAEAKVHLSDYQTMTIYGGQGGCFYLAPGTYSFRVTSPDPYSGERGKATGRSHQYKVVLGDGERALFRVFPNAKGPFYERGWRAKRAITERRANCR